MLWILKVTVDSVFTVNINERELIRQWITYTKPNQHPLDSWKYGATVTETIGDSYFLFNLYSTSMVCDGNWSEGLRCYEDPDFGFYSTGIAESCNYTYIWTGIDKLETKMDFEIFPNPIEDIFWVKTDASKLLKYEIIGLSGLVIKSGKISPGAYINISDLQQEIYVLRIISNDTFLGTLKIVKK